MDDAPFSLFMKPLVFETDRRSSKHGVEVSAKKLSIETSEKFLIFIYVRNYLVELERELEIVEVCDRTELSAQ